MLRLLTMKDIVDELGENEFVERRKNINGYVPAVYKDDYKVAGTKIRVWNDEGGYIDRTYYGIVPKDGGKVLYMDEI